MNGPRVNCDSLGHWFYTKFKVAPKKLGWSKPPAPGSGTAKGGLVFERLKFIL